MQSQAPVCSAFRPAAMHSRMSISRIVRCPRPQEHDARSLVTSTGIGDFILTLQLPVAGGSGQQAAAVLPEVSLAARRQVHVKGPEDNRQFRSAHPLPAVAAWPKTRIFTSSVIAPRRAPWWQGRVIAAGPAAATHAA